MANYSLFGGPTQLQQQLQNIYDDAHEGTLQAVLLETAQQDGPALQAWTLCLFSINAKIKQVENSKPRSDTERGLLNSILELEQECRERIGNLERKKQVSTNPYVTQASLPSINNLSLGNSSAPLPPSHGASSSNMHNPFQGYDSRLQQQQQVPPQVRPYYQTQNSQQSLQPALQPQLSNPSSSSINRYNVPRKQVPGSSSNINTSPKQPQLLDLDMSPGKNDTLKASNLMASPVNFDRPKPVVAPVQTQYQYTSQQSFQPVEPEVRRERYEERSQERQYNSDFTPVSAHQRSTSSSSTVYTPVNSRPDLQPLSSASSPTDAPPSPPKREMLKTLRGATSSKKQPSASTANEAPLKGASLAWKFKNFGKSQEEKKPEQPKPAKVKPTRSNAPSVSSQATRPNYSTTSVNTSNTTAASSIPQSTKSNNIKSMLLDDDEPVARQAPAPVQHQQPAAPAPAAHPVHPVHTPPTAHTQSAPHVTHSPPPHVTHAPASTKQTPTAHQATYNALHGQAARRSGEVRRSGETARRSGESRRSGEIRRPRPTSGMSVRSTASEAGDTPWAGFTSVGSAAKQQQHSNNSSTSSLTSAQTAAAGAGAQKAAQAQQAALAHNRALKPVSSPSTNANPNHSAKKPAYQYIVQPTPAKPQQSAATRAALAKSKQLNERTKAKRQAAASAQNRTRQVNTPPAQGRPAQHQQPQSAKQILNATGGRQESPSAEQPEEEKKPMTEWDKKVAEIMKDLRGVDENAAKQILNEIVVQGDEVHWEDIAGLEAAKSSLKETVVYPFLRPDLFSGLREPARGMLLFGPPGTGKTMLARAVATESNSTFFSISASSLTSKFLGESEKLVRALFFMAKALAPSIIFVDEIDSLLSQRSDSGEHEASRRIKNEFLVQWSDLASAAAGREREGDVQRVLVLAATNLPWGIDEAARRRFVRRQYIPLPEIETREAQFTKLLAAQRTNLTEEERKGLLELTEGFSGSDITALTKDAAMGPLRALGDKLLTTSREDIRPIGYQDFISSLAFIRPSVSKEGLKAFEDWAAEYGSSGA
ncbi:putative AAA domain-containing protein [Yarrowia sp. C11]|nr:putative AAA domain-containing protein [Yarrowia sp. E02]KAG5372480.1 putative AAA domain-containing protein [Yarrowia sp. C11]